MSTMVSYHGASAHCGGADGLFPPRKHVTPTWEPPATSYTLRELFPITFFATILASYLKSTW